VLEITVKNHEEIDNSWNGSKICELLENLKKTGSYPENFPDMTSMDAPFSIPVAEIATTATPLV
jgi:hypothetical protein